MDIHAEQSEVSEVVSSTVKTPNLKGVTQPTINEVAAMIAHFKGWKIPTLVNALAVEGFVHRSKWSSGETRITEEEISRMNHCLSRHIDGQIMVNRNFIWFSKPGGGGGGGGLIIES